MNPDKLAAAVDAYDRVRLKAWGPREKAISAETRTHIAPMIRAAIEQYMGMLGEVEFIDAETGAVRRGILL